MVKGIDVSEFQGNIDFNKVKSAGYSFVIVRAGFGKLESQADKCFKQNMDGALAAGLDVGAYWFSYATSEKEAKEEARLFARLMEPYKKKARYPLFYDYEYSSYDYSVSMGITPTKKLITDMAAAFIEELDKLGWYAGYYTNLDYYYTRLETQRLKNYPLWLAQYSGSADIECIIQQYASDGRVSGIYGYTDLNRAYEDIPQIIEKLGKNGFDKSEEVLLQVSGNGVRLREEPNTAGKILYALYIGDKVSFIRDMNNGWSEVEYKNQKGYMSNLYLKGRELSAYPTAKNSGNYVNFRSEGSLNGKIITQIFSGETFPVISVINGWIFTSIGGKDGYVYFDSSYIKIE